MATGPTLTRTVFQTSRELEFFTEEELTMQIGFPRSQWPLALLKELLDNALDACETAGQPPDITVTVTEDTVSVQDNGPGLPVSTLERSLNYLVRVSDKAHYVSPTRGQLGNALKCVWAAPYVLDGTHSRVEVSTDGCTHQLDVTLDRIAQQPKVEVTTHEDGFVKRGTRITLYGPEIASSLVDPAIDDFYNGADLVRRYAAFNPHATFRYTAPDGTALHFPCTTSTWGKWLPSQPTSPHWYTVTRLQALLAAYLAEDRRRGRVRTVREVVAEFAGLSATAKQKTVTADAALARASLEDLVIADTLAEPQVHALLKAMQAQSRPINPSALGVLGEAHLRTFLVHQMAVTPGSVKYKKYANVADGVPYVLELACGWYAAEARVRKAAKVLGFNWTPALRPPFTSLPTLLGEARVDSWDPIVIVVHLACPRLEVTDRGKSAVAVPQRITQALQEGVRAVTKHWTALKRHADRENRVRERELEQWHKLQKRQWLTVKDAAWQVMEQAYLLASDNGTLPANARQIMYAARPRIIALTNRNPPWTDSTRFTQHLLPDFLQAYPDLTAGWDVVFDARGHFLEPHTGHQLGLGTLEVRQYIARWQPTLSLMLNPPELSHALRTRGPAHRYQYVLFVEKEGFNPLLAAGGIADKYDLAIMSTKGMSVTAARRLVEALTRAGVTLLVLHDFDKAGIEILDKFRSDTRRYSYSTTPHVIDLGLRLEDAQNMSLESEPVAYDSEVDPRKNLRRCGATEEECAFLVHRHTDDGWEGERIELNAMTSQQFLTWLEDMLALHGVEKVVPEPTALAQAYQYMTRLAMLQRALDAAFAILPAAHTIVVPDTLTDAIRDALTDTPTIAWDAALWDLVCEVQEARDDEEAL
jgi:DNA topoisomerase VI subunit B